jgi:sugar phosphate isomerase/epimerase
MLRSIATVSLSGNLLEKLEAAAAARFDSVEIFETDLVNYPGSPDEIRRTAADSAWVSRSISPSATSRRRPPSGGNAISTAPSASSM